MPESTLVSLAFHIQISISIFIYRARFARYCVPGKGSKVLDGLVPKSISTKRQSAYTSKVF